MLETIFTGTLTAEIFLFCIFSATALGLLIALSHAWRNTSSRNFLSTLVLLPGIVATVILLVNGNVGAGVAVAGSFSLVRFRSVPGNSREIASVFLAMAAGLACGVGYIGLAAMFTLLMSAVSCLLLLLPGGKESLRRKELRVTIPENLDYTDIFEDIFSEYTEKTELQRVKTVNMGSLYELVYRTVLKNPAKEKDFIDELRTRNGNLEIALGRIPDREEAL